MTIRSDVSFEMELSPRLITVAAPSTDINIQDLHDTIIAFEDTILGGQYPRLILSAGNEDLGGGTFVGLTSTLQNAQIEFEARTMATSSGSATSTGIQVLTDTSATFLADGVVRGALIINFIDNSVATVLSIDSETQITHTVFTGGSNNDWSISDTYRVTNEVQCEISGGNLVSIDDVDTVIPTVFPSLGTQIVRSSASSATISGLEITNLQRLIESLRKSHAGYGNIYYWDPFLGNDNNAGDLPSRAKKTFTAAHALTLPFHNDVIFALPGDPDSQTITTIPIKITNQNVHIRGPGRQFHIEVDDDTVPAVWMNAMGCSIEGVNIQQLSVVQPGLLVDRENFLFKDLIVRQCGGNGIEQTVTSTPLTNKPIAIYENVESIQNGGHALRIYGNVQLTFIRQHCHFEESGLDGISIDTDVDDIHLIAPIIHENARFGINIADATVLNTAIIDPLYINNGTDFQDLGTDTVVISKKTNIIEQLLRNKMITDPITGKATIYAEDGTTVLFQGDIFEDALGSTPYNSTSGKIERRERLA